MKRVAELDGIRGLAALAVVGYHLAPGLVPEGWMAVDCFFVLSGYLITSILLKNRDDPDYYKNFYARRILRIWPIYYIALFGLMIANRAFGNYFRTDGFWYYLLYFQNIQTIWYAKPPAFIPAFEHTWTLALEEQFYILWPFLVRNLNRRALIALIVPIALNAIFLRMTGMLVVALPARCDGFVCGALLAMLLSESTSWTAHRARNMALFAVLGVVGSVLLAYVMTGPHAIPTPWRALRVDHDGAEMIAPGNLIFSAAIGVVILNAGTRWLGALRSRPLVYLGTISYGLYLYHIPVMHMMEMVFRKFGRGAAFDGTRPLYRTLLELTVSLVIAHLSWTLFERPLLRLKDRFHYKREPILTPTEADGVATRAETVAARPASGDA